MDEDTRFIANVDRRSLLAGLVGDGRPLLSLTGLALVGTGMFALFLSAMRQFLPHDVAFLGMNPSDLCALNECRVVHFMLHDRVAFGGTLIAVGTLYLWLAAFPLRQRAAWSWWLFVVSGTLGFGSFLLYLGYGYLDTWHGAATLVLLPCFLFGLLKSFAALEGARRLSSLFRPSEPTSWKTAEGVGRLCLLATAVCMAIGGCIIMIVGMTRVFVPQDLVYLQLTSEQMTAINPRLVPLIAHDRAGFGGGVCCCGVTMFFSVWCGRPSRSLWQALLIVGCIGFGTAIGVHPVIGYVDQMHLAPAYIGATMFLTGMVLSARRMFE